MRAYYQLCADRLNLHYRVRSVESEERSFISQLFWRFPDEPFSEERSTKLYHTTGPETTSLRLQIPPLTSPS